VLAVADEVARRPGDRPVRRREELLVHGTSIPYSLRAASTETTPFSTSSATAAGSRSRGSPTPPPPALWLSTRVPAGTGTTVCGTTGSTESPRISHFACTFFACAPLDPPPERLGDG